VNNKPVVPLQGSTGADNEVGTETGPEKPAAAKPPAPTPVETGSQVGTSAANGSEELELALSYLNGIGGKTSNSGEAVKWLWKAVAKQNAEATELLADLYLKGEEVPRNCEQARLLLDAAARRGVKEAAERLRHLQDSGCP
jgi:TPR repeat protein